MVLTSVVEDSRLYVVVEGQGRHFALDVGHIVGPTIADRLPCTITPFY